ncbi:MAG: ABC transporter permease [Planctomycetaceae bacterium]
MNLVTIAFKSIKQRALASSLTALSVALGVMLMVSVLVIFGIVEKIFTQRTIAYHLIVGPARGSDLQLVLNAVYRVAPPVENLPWLYYEEIKKDPRVVAAIPLTLGDFTEQGSFPLVGTIPEYFEHEYAPGETFRIRGNPFQTSFDAIIGAEVARVNNWDIGSQFTLVHGGAESDHVHDEKFTVKAVLEATGTPNDKTVFIHLSGFFAIAGHDKPFDQAVKRWRDFNGLPVDDASIAADVKEWRKKYGLPEVEVKVPGHEGHSHEPVTDIQKEVTAIFLEMKNDQSALLFSSELKKGYKAQAINPIFPMRRLMQQVVGNVRTALVVLTGLIIIVSGVSIFVSIYNSMADRRKEIAIMRALGAQRATVFSIILTESILLCFGGGLLGMLLGHGLVFLAGPIVQEKSGLLINPYAFEPLELVLLPILIVLASLVGIVPGLTAYRTDVARTLAD